MIRRIVFVVTLLVVLAACGVARADFIATTGGHGPLSEYGAFPDRGAVWLFNPNTGAGEFWLGDMGDYYVVHPSQGGLTWLTMSTSYTYAIAYEFEVRPGAYAGRNVVLTSSWSTLSWAPQAVIVRYDPPCPSSPTMTSIHVCTANYTPMDGAGKPTVVITDNFGHPLNLSGSTNHVECEAHLSSYPLVPHPPGMPDDVAAVYVCP